MKLIGFARLNRLVGGLVTCTALMGLPVMAHAGKSPLVDTNGAIVGTVTATLARGSVKLKVKGLAPLPAATTTQTGTFTATEYKAYLVSSIDPAIEIFLGDLYPSKRQRAALSIALRGDLSQMGFDRVTITAFSKDGQESFDILTATLGE